MLFMLLRLLGGFKSNWVVFSKSRVKLLNYLCSWGYCKKNSWMIWGNVSKGMMCVYFVEGLYKICHFVRNTRRDDIYICI